MNHDESTAERGDVWQEADGVAILCVEPGQVWQDFRGDRFAWDSPRLAKPLRRLLDPAGNIVLYPNELTPWIKADALRTFVLWIASNRAYNGASDPGQSLYNDHINDVLPRWAEDFIKEMIT